jgi:hypothetical protein
VVETKVAKWITEKEFGVLFELYLPQSFAMIKEEVVVEGRNSYVITFFKNYVEENDEEGIERFVLSRKLYLTLRLGSRHYFEKNDCCWRVLSQRKVSGYEHFFQRDQHGYHNEMYGNYNYINKLEGTELEEVLVRSPMVETKYKMLTDDCPKYNVCRKRKMYETI